MPNFKLTVKNAVDALRGVQGRVKLSEKELAVRQLGIASELARIGEADKKKAKAALVDLGVIRNSAIPTPGNSAVLFDGEEFTLTATTKQPGTRLDAAKLDIALAQENLSMAARRRILAASTVENAPATSYAVESK